MSLLLFEREYSDKSNIFREAKLSIEICTDSDKDVTKQQHSLEGEVTYPCCTEHPSALCTYMNQ